MFPKEHIRYCILNRFLNGKSYGKVRWYKYSNFKDDQIEAQEVKVATQEEWNILPWLKCRCLNSLSVCFFPILSQVILDTGKCIF